LRVDLELVDTWGDQYYMGLTGLELRGAGRWCTLHRRPRAFSRCHPLLPLCDCACRWPCCGCEPFPGGRRPAGFELAPRCVWG
jgi:hypothetical protein